MTGPEVLAELDSIIKSRAENPVPGSYVALLLADEKGVDRVLEKVGEEATEFIIAVKNGDRRRIIEEAADLEFHLLVALRAAGIDLSEVMDELGSRRK
jgi:phosphoribosyl-ATP pyrophosphohydrolase